MITFYTQSDFDKTACNWVLEKGMTGNRSTWMCPRAVPRRYVSGIMQRSY